MKRFITLVLFISSTAYSQTNTFPSSGNVGIGTISPSAKLEVNQAGGGSGQNVALKAWAGNDNNYFGNSQIQFSYGGGSGGYSHAIKSRHSSCCIAGNSIDFYLWQPGDPVNGEGSLQTLTLNGGKVGIGTNSPIYKLDLQTVAPTKAAYFQTSGSWQAIDFSSDGGISKGSLSAVNGVLGIGSAASGTNSFLNINLTSGYVGIGTTSPSAQLHVVGPSTGHGLTIQADGGGDVMLNSGGSLFFDGNYSYASGNYIRPVSANTQTFVTSGVERMRITNSGYIGIGTSSPDAKLSVSGQVHAQEVKVSITVPGPDYVFDKDYQLTSLDSIKNYIDQNKHLPEVPSAREMEKNGVQLGEMNMLLLKKIEELTLYVIEQKNEINELRK